MTFSLRKNWLNDFNRGTQRDTIFGGQGSFWGKEQILGAAVEVAMHIVK